MTPRTRRSKRVATAVAAISLALSSASSALADPTPSRDYPQRYSDRKPAWYDPFGWFTGGESKPASATTTTESKPVSTSSSPRSAEGPPAWQWYGYGAPTPGRNPYAPNGNYAPVPVNWHELAGSTPGAIPANRATNTLVMPVPLPLNDVSPLNIDATVSKPAKPASVEGPSIANVVEPNWSTAPASIGLPSNDGPKATLKAPLPATPTSNVPKTPAPILPAPSPAVEPPDDIPVEAAPGIVIPRGLAPAPSAVSVLKTAVRRAGGLESNVIAIDMVGTDWAILRVSGPRESVLQLRQRLSNDTALRGWRIDFDMVTPVGR